MQDRIYLGIHRRVLCLDKRTGRETWRTELKRTHLVTFMVVGDMILAHAGGSLYGLRVGDGTLAADAAGSSLPAAAFQQAQQAQAVAVAATVAATTAASAS
jgi:outer membrane protein assembly factor BamB